MRIDDEKYYQLLRANDKLEMQINKSNLAILALEQRIEKLETNNLHEPSCKAVNVKFDLSGMCNCNKADIENFAKSVETMLKKLSNKNAN